jgi:hypothetical protein
MSEIKPASFVGELLDVLLYGDDPVLARLSAQLALARVREEQVSEYGVWIDLWIDDSAEPLEFSHRFAIDDVFGRVEGVDGEVGFQLHIVRGRVKTVEAWVSEPGWPDSPHLLETWYVAPDADPEAAELVRVTERDLEFAVRGIEGDGED